MYLMASASSPERDEAGPDHSRWDEGMTTVQDVLTSVRRGLGFGSAMV